MVTYWNRLEPELAARKMSRQQLADKLGISYPAVKKVVNGGAFGSENNLKLAEFLGVNPLWLATGKGPKTGFNLANLQYAGANVTTSPGPSPVPAPGTPGVPVPMLDNAASMGGGSDALSEDVLAGQITLAPSFVHDYIRPSSPDALRFIHGYGDSMHPTFNSGDVLLVDTGVREPRIDGIYVLQAHGRLFIKRVRQRMDGSHEISSDNPAHKTVDTLNGDHIIDVLGRVVWCWNGRKI